MSNAPTLVGQQGDSLREAFGQAIAEQGAADQAVTVLDADVAGGTGAHHFRSMHPERFIQCGIAEQNMIGVAAGMAHSGFKPFVTTFAVFMLRAIEQIRLSVCYSQKNVKLIASHPGLDVGPDGASAQSLEDIACMRAMPGMVVLSPCDAREVRAATKALVHYHGPAYMRTGRSHAPAVYKEDPIFEIGKGVVFSQGTDLTLISTGVTTHRAIQATKNLNARGISVRHIHLPSIKPIDRPLIHAAANETQLMLSCEDHNIIGGLGSAVAEVCSEIRSCPLIRLGIKDTIGRSGEPDELAAYYGIDANGIENTALTGWEKVTSQ